MSRMILSRMLMKLWHMYRWKYISKTCMFRNLKTQQWCWTVCRHQTGAAPSVISRFQMLEAISSTNVRQQTLRGIIVCIRKLIIITTMRIMLTNQIEQFLILVTTIKVKVDRVTFSLTLITVSVMQMREKVAGPRVNAKARPRKYQQRHTLQRFVGIHIWANRYDSSKSKNID